MGKRKSNTARIEEDAGAESDSSSGSSAPSLIDVDFDFLPPSLDVDLIALKRLLRQLLWKDSDLFDLHPLAELILERCEQDGLGSCIKVDGPESDPFSFLSVLNLNVYKDHVGVAPVLAHLIKQASSTPALKTLLSNLNPSSGPQIGLLVSERLINMPVQTQPPMYRMLGEEMSAAVASGKPYNFTHFLLVSKLYVSPGAVPSMTSGASKKNKKKKKAVSGMAAPPPDEDAMDVDTPGEVLPFHPEDSLLLRHALHSTTYKFSSAPSRVEDDPMEFGLDQRGGMMLFEADKWPAMMKTLEEGCV